MRVAITADLQAALYPALSVPDPSGGTSRLRDLMDCLDWMEGEAAEAGVERFMILGDVFDSRVGIDIPVLDTMCRKVKHLATRFSAADLLPGNHDSYLRDARLTSVSAFFGAATVHDVPSVVGPFGFVPWTEDVGQISAGVDYCLKHKASVLCAHLTVKGSVPGGKGVPIEVLKPEKFKRVFLGDVHDPLQMGENVMYVGSPWQIDFRDAGKDRGFVIYDTKTDEVEFFGNTVSPCFHLIEEGTTHLHPPIGPRDFVRVVNPNPEAAAEAVAWAKQKTGWVESRVVKVDDDAPRLSLSVGDDVTAVLTAYARHKLPDAPDEAVAELVEVGLELVQEGKDEYSA
jgi:hypothetical protein